jgi:enoyl-CoA hydratase/carnithine racemase
MSKARFDLDGEVGIVTISDPPLNLFGLELIEDLTAATHEVARQPIRALLLRAEGENFSAGAQVDEVFGDLSAAEGERRIERFLELAQFTERLPFPTLAAVRGLCLAAGLETVLTTDLIWASEDAHFAFAEPMIGLTPIVGGAYRLAARAGTGRAVETVLTARPYPAATFAEWGVVNRVLPDADLDRKALAFAHALAAGPPRADEVTRKLLLAYREQGLAAADALTAKACAPLFETDDLAHGIRSLLADGPGHATFRGR